MEHPVLGYYLEVFALSDIDVHVELFARYGEEYWKTYQHYFKCEDPHILTNEEYDIAMKDFA